MPVGASDARDSGNRVAVAALIRLGCGVQSTFARLDPPRPSPTARWAGEAFRDELAAWVAQSVGPVRLMTQTKLRFWATVWRAETDDTAYYAKQNCELQSYEAALVALLAEVVPDAVVPVAAVDPGRGLLLTPDQGQVLAATAAEDDLAVWERVVVAAALLQRELVPYVDRLAAVGLTRLTSADAPAYVEMRLEELAGRPPGDPMRLGEDEAAAVAAHLPAVRDWSEQVAALGLPVTLNHNDVHDNNVFAVGEDLRFFDFGDAMLTDPLSVLLVPLNMLADRLGAGPDDPRLHAVTDAALEVWSDLATMAELRRALPAALRLGRLSRLETWVRCCVSADAAELAEWGEAVPQSLAKLVLDPPIGRLG